jgi:hypothetical protein
MAWNENPVARHSETDSPSGDSAPPYIVISSLPPCVVSADYPTVDSAPLQLSAANYYYIRPESPLGAGYPYNPIQHLLNQPLAKNFFGLSRQRAELQDAYDDTLAQANLWVSHLDDDHLIEPAGPCYWETEHNRHVLLQIPGDRIHVVIGVFGGTGSGSFPPIKLILFFALLSAQRLARRLFIKIRQAAQLLFQPIPTPTFCGVSWSRRAWFLFHGARPPKPELGPSIDLMFGCA